MANHTIKPFTKLTIRSHRKKHIQRILLVSSRFQFPLSDFYPAKSYNIRKRGKWAQLSSIPKWPPGYKHGPILQSPFNGFIVDLSCSLAMKFYWIWHSFPFHAQPSVLTNILKQSAGPYFQNFELKLNSIYFIQYSQITAMYTYKAGESGIIEY